ncbi:hypothetical protein [Minwuia sp.]|uniref:hypothetical protein n=1 Tax=Minwuia sp. TaxID=2493630 RepID=UPI003A8F641D
MSIKLREFQALELADREFEFKRRLRTEKTQVKFRISWKKAALYLYDNHDLSESEIPWFTNFRHSLYNDPPIASTELYLTLLFYMTTPHASETARVSAAKIINQYFPHIEIIGHSESDADTETTPIIEKMDLRYQGPSRDLDNKFSNQIIDEFGLRRELIESIAFHFRHEDPAATDQDLIAFIKQKAIESQEMQSRWEALQKSDQIAQKYISEAMTFFMNGQFDEAQVVLDQWSASIDFLPEAHRSEKQAEIMTEKGSLYLISNKFGLALDTFENAVSQRALISEESAADLREGIGGLIYQHCLRFRPSKCVHVIDFLAKNEDFYINRNDLRGLISSVGVQASAAAESLEYFSEPTALATIDSLQAKIERVRAILGTSEDQVQAYALDYLSAVLKTCRSDFESEKLQKEAYASFIEITQKMLGAEPSVDDFTNPIGVKFFLSIAEYQYAKLAGLAENKDIVLSSIGRLEGLLGDPNVTNIPLMHAGFLSTYSEICDELSGEYGLIFDKKLSAIAVQAVRTACDIYKKLNRTKEFAENLTGLGSALSTASLRYEGNIGKEAFSESKKIYETALQFWPREEYPSNWAKAQTNIGYINNLEVSRSPLQDRPPLLFSVVESYCRAIEEREELGQILDAALIYQNLSAAYNSLGSIYLGEQALCYFLAAIKMSRACLAVYGKDRFPIKYARASINLSNSMRSIARMSRDARSIKFAKRANQINYGAGLALQNSSRTDDFGMVLNNLTVSRNQLGMLTKNVSEIEKALVSCQAALKFRTRNNTPQNWGNTQHNLAFTLMNRYVLSQEKGDFSGLVEALSAVRQALEVRLFDVFPNAWLESKILEVNILRLQCDAALNTGKLDAADECLKEAYKLQKIELNDDTELQLDLGRILCCIGAAEITAGKSTINTEFRKLGIEKLERGLAIAGEAIWQFEESEFRSILAQSNA